MPIKRTLWFCEDVNKSGHPYPGDHYNPPELQGYEPADIDSANLVSSLTRTGNQAPVIDFDIPIKAVPSTTEGHYHLYIEKEISWTAYKRILDALSQAGLIDGGWKNTAIIEKKSYVRPPWLKKGEEPKKKWEPLKVTELSKSQIKSLMSQASIPIETVPQPPIKLNTSTVANFTLNLENGMSIKSVGHCDNAGWWWPDVILKAFGYEPEVEKEQWVVKDED